MQQQSRKGGIVGRHDIQCRHFYKGRKNESTRRYKEDTYPTTRMRVIKRMRERAQVPFQRLKKKAEWNVQRIHYVEHMRNFADDTLQK